MGESIYLMGSEDVQSAGFVMRDAAKEMTQAANQIWEAMIRFEQAVDRLEIISEAQSGT